MPVTVTFLNAIGYGVAMQNLNFGYDYFQKFTKVVSADVITNTYTTTDFNALGIGRVVQEISRTADESTIRFFAGDVEVIRVKGLRTDVGAYDDTEIEALMDRAISGFASGDPVIVGTRFSDNLIGNDNDKSVMKGGLGDDSLMGGYQADTLIGGKGKDFLAGDGGRDILTGGAKADTFFFDNYGNTDHITDFNVMQDRIQFDDDINPSSLKLTQTAEGVQVVAGSQLTIILDGLTLADVQANANFDFLM